MFEGVRDHLLEVQVAGFPLEYQKPGEAIAGEHNVEHDAYREEHERNFFRAVDEELTKVLASNSLPVVVTGVERNLAFWDELSTNKSQSAGTLEGSYDKSTPHELGLRVWPVMQDFMAQNRAQVLDELGTAMGAQKYAAGMDEVWTLAHEGRGATLLVEEDFHYAGKVDANGQMRPAEEGAMNADSLSDAVDHLIEAVLDTSGRVVFVDSGSLKTQGHIALILRY